MVTQTGAGNHTVSQTGAGNHGITDQTHQSMWYISVRAGRHFHVFLPSLTQKDPFF